jgi:hypothetical protein
MQFGSEVLTLFLVATSGALIVLLVVVAIVGVEESSLLMLGLDATFLLDYRGRYDLTARDHLTVAAAREFVF